MRIIDTGGHLAWLARSDGKARRGAGCASSSVALEVLRSSGGCSAGSGSSRRSSAFRRRCTAATVVAAAPGAAAVAVAPRPPAAVFRLVNPRGAQLCVRTCTLRLRLLCESGPPQIETMHRK